MGRFHPPRTSTVKFLVKNREIWPHWAAALHVSRRGADRAAPDPGTVSSRQRDQRWTAVYYCVYAVVFLMVELSKKQNISITCVSIKSGK